MSSMSKIEKGIIMSNCKINANTESADREN